MAVDDTRSHAHDYISLVDNGVTIKANAISELQLDLKALSLQMKDDIDDWQLRAESRTDTKKRNERSIIIE